MQSMISPDKVPQSIKNFVRPLIMPKIDKGISKRFRTINQNGMSLIEKSLKKHYITQDHAWYNEEYLSSDTGNTDLQNQLHRRLDGFRKTVIPWLSAVRPLPELKILEIGCGTGSSTVALAEQGAEVTGVDILESSLHVAEDRCKVYDLRANFFCANATELHRIFAGQHFDLIIFFATLEHMTHEERMIAMRKTWEMLALGSLWCVVDTPNRLWYFDDHTSLLPFYQWLPDDLAFLYSQFSPRESFRDLYREPNNDTKLDFLRRGRGVSFHEFELTMKRADELDVLSSRSIYLRKKNLLGNILLTPTNVRRFESFLIRVGPKIHPGFYQRNLDLIIRKD